jgi:basic amino acid/polyamine antiporter, APA family
MTSQSTTKEGKQNNTSHPKGLTPALGLAGATAINLGAIVGAGIYAVLGIIAGVAGPALLLSIGIAALVALLTALSFSEVAAQIPREGSVYEFGHELISPLAGFLAGWMWMLANVFAGAAVALTFAHYVAPALPGVPVQGIAVALTIVFTALNLLGVRHSSTINVILVATNLAVLLVFMAFGFTHLTAGNFKPFVPAPAGVLLGAYYIFFAYSGFGRAATVAEEIKNPERTVPRAVLLSIIISTAFYLGVGIAAIGLAGAPTLAQSVSPLADAIRATGPSLIAYIVSVGGLLATASVLLTSILGVSRVAFAMARRGDLPRPLSIVHPRYNSPTLAVLITGGAITLLTLFTDLTGVVAISTFALLFYYGLTNGAALRLTAHQREYPNVVPVLGMLTCGGLLLVALIESPVTWVLGLTSLGVGVLLYAVKKW